MTQGKRKTDLEIRDLHIAYLASEKGLDAFALEHKTKFAVLKKHFMRLGLELKTFKIAPSFYEEAHKRYLAGESIEALSKVYNVARSALSRGFKRLGLARKNKKWVYKERDAKNVATLQERYGVSNAVEVPGAKEKAAATIQDRYGDHFSRTAEVKERKRLTNQDRYGVDHTFQAPVVKAKTEETWLRTLGVTHPMKNREVVEKARASKIDRRFKELEPHLTTLGYELLETYVGNRDGGHWRRYKVKHSCGEEFLDDVFMTPRCPRCYPLNVSVQEKEYVRFIESFGVDVIENDRSVIVNPATGRFFELDMYLPDLGMAFEYNGLYTHAFKTKDYHKLKTDLCLAKGVKLFHIWSHHDVDSVKSKIAHMLGKSKPTAFARQTKIVEDIDVADFFRTQHLSKNRRAEYSVALKCEGEVVAAMSFTRASFSGETELARFASKGSVPGAFSKLLKTARTRIQGPLVSYCDRDWTPDWRDSVCLLYTSPSPRD